MKRGRPVKTVWIGGVGYNTSVPSEPQIDVLFGAALLIACEKFVDPQYKHLVVPIRDARRFAKVLEGPEIGQFSVELLENATRDVITDKLEEFFENCRPEDILLLYFAGHGDLDDRRNLYFVAHDTRKQKTSGKWNCGPIHSRNDGPKLIEKADPHTRLLL